jgi:hypothetical protein
VANIAEAYKNANHVCLLGFVPSHYAPADAGAAAAVAPITHCDLYRDGWCIDVNPSSDGLLADADFSGWVALKPSRHAAGGIAAGADTSAYATTTVVPPVPKGGAVEFAVDYDAGTCSVAFYTPAVVAGGFVEAPHAKMELRFVATTAHEACKIPARGIPTLAGSSAELYPAVGTSLAGAVWRFAP